MSRRYKSQGKIGLFDKEFATKHLSEMGNPLEAISVYFNPKVYQ